MFLSDGQAVCVCVCVSVCVSVCVCVCVYQTQYKLCSCLVFQIVAYELYRYKQLQQHSIIE